VARTGSDPTGLAGAIKDQILLIDKDQPVYAVQTMKQLMSESVSRERFNMTLLTVFAAVALVLAAVGVYGVMSYSVAERRHEIGIRMALGASSRDVLGMILRQTASLALAGLGIGIFAAVMLTRLMTGLLYEVSATDGVTFAVVSALLAGVALAATYVPARRATKLDPMIALRHE
jgi:putative ABC transport system permease protein